MGTDFEDEALAEFIQWVHEDKKTADKIYNLIKDINRNGAAQGLGKPERLKHLSAWSRRIDKENRLVYDVDTDGTLHIFSCKGHYKK